MQTAGRLVKCVPGLERLDRLVIETPLVFTLQDVPEYRARVAVRWTALARFHRHLDHRHAGLLAIKLLRNILFGNLRHLAKPVLASQGHATNPGRGTDDERDKR